MKMPAASKHAADAARRGRSRAFARAITRAPIACALACAALALCIVGALRALPIADTADTTTPLHSTPVSEWAQGAIPHLYQTDPAWAHQPYAGGTVEENGCGPTCLSMVYIDLTGKTNLNPAEMARYSEKNGYVDGDMTSWTLMTEGAARLGLSSEELPADEDAVRSALSRGKPVICSVGPGDFTTSGHFIVLAGLDDAGRAIVHDPNSAERSEKPWEIGRVLSQCRNLWAFTTPDGA